MDSRIRLDSLVGRVVPTVLSGVLWAVGEEAEGGEERSFTTGPW